MKGNKMDINNCRKKDYLRCAYNLDFISPSTVRYSRSEISIIELTEICLDIILLDKQDYKNIVRINLCYGGGSIYFIWNSSIDDFRQWYSELDEIPYEEDDELKFLDKFLSYAESITNSNNLYNKRRIDTSIKYKLR